MRGSDKRSASLFSYVDLEARVRRDHSLRRVRSLTGAALANLSEDFSQLYSGMGRPSVPPEMLVRAMLLQGFYSIRSERQLMERLEFDLLFLWFVGLRIDDPAWDHSSFTKNRDQLLEGEIAARFLAAVLAKLQVKRLLSTDHFSVDGTVIEACASMKSFKPREPGDDDAPPPASSRRNTEVVFKGRQRYKEGHKSWRRGFTARAPHGGQALPYRPHPDGEPIGLDRRYPPDRRRRPRRPVDDRAARRPAPRATSPSISLGYSRMKSSRDS